MLRALAAIWVIIFLVMGIFFLSWASCETLVADMPILDHRWSVLGGCEVEVERGVWTARENLSFRNLADDSP